jgi:anti-sigma28 factor (negative regulator of flagellin synthesis)
MRRSRQATTSHDAAPRWARVAQIRARVRTGRYLLDAEAIARALLDAEPRRRPSRE